MCLALHVVEGAGRIDWTTFVDFTNLAAAGERRGWRTLRPLRKLQFCASWHPRTSRNEAQVLWSPESPGTVQQIELDFARSSAALVSV